MWSSGADYGDFSGVSVDAYVKDIPVDRIKSDVLIAYEMNGEPLTPEHGFPARLVVPGFYDDANSVKWLTRVSLAADRASGPFTTRCYNHPVQDAREPASGPTVPVWAIAHNRSSSRRLPTQRLLLPRRPRFGVGPGLTAELAT